MSKYLLSLMLLLPLLSMLAVAVPAAEFPSQLQAGEYRLVLNGSGARTKTLLQLYVAGLYLTRSNSNPAEIVAANEAMAIRIKITSGFVSQNSLVESLEEGFKASTAVDIRTIRSEIEKFRECFKDDITKGDTFDLVYLPEHGVIVNKNGKLKGVVAGTEFKQALFSIWLSDKPVDKTLKQAMLSTGDVR